MPRIKVDPRAKETDSERACADAIADNGPSLESIAGTVPESENPYEPAKSIDANPDKRDRA